MAEEFLKLNADFRELEALKRGFQFKRPSQAIAAIRTTLNDQAFGTMNKAKKSVMPRVFNIRNAWVQSSVQVKKAVGHNTNLMQAITGSKTKWSRNRGAAFMGLREQEFGATKSSPDIATLAARISGSFRKKVSGKNRFNRLGDIKRANEFKGNSPEHRITVMLRTLAAQGYKGGMFIRKSNKFKTGIYKFKGRGRRARTGGVFRPVVMIKDLSESSVRIPRKPWLSVSTRKAVTKATTVRAWRRNAARFTTKTR